MKELLSPMYGSRERLPPLLSLSNRLTDGEVLNAEEVIQLVREQAGTTRIFTFAIGNEADKNMLHGTDGCGRALIFFTVSD